jgi:hypothetical protein
LNKFEQINTLPVYNNLLDVISTVLPTWQDYSQISINTVEGHDDHQHGVGSLYYDWHNKTVVDGNITVPVRKDPLKEEDFTTLCSIWEDTVFKDIYQTISEQYHVGRLRIITSQPKSCLSWHTDDTARLHYPIKTQQGCMMIIEDEVKCLTEGQWWLTNTTYPHTAVNSSMESRVHLVVCILGEKT